MIKLNPTTGTLVANATIPLTVEDNSNPTFSLSNNAINVKQPGRVEIIGDINVTATVAGPIAINLVADGTVKSTTSVVATAIGDVLTIPVYNLFRVIPQSLLSNYANISFQLVNPATISGGVITAKYIR